MKILKLILLLIILSILIISCGTENEQADEIYPYLFFTIGGSGYDEANTVTETTDGGFVVTGFTTSKDGDFTGLIHGIEDIAVVKLDQYGHTQWKKTFGGSQWNIGTSVAATIDGGVILTGITGSADGLFSDLEGEGQNIFALKLDESGNVEWVKTFFASGPEVAKSVIQMRDGSYALTGSTRSMDGDFEYKQNNSWDIFVISLNSSGETDWIKTYGGLSAEQSYAIAETDSGDLVITGFSSSNDDIFFGLNRGLQDIFLMNINKSGELNWVQTYGGSNGDIANALALTSDGGILLTGRTWSDDGQFSEGNGGDIFVIKTDQSGQPQWIRTYGGSYSEEAMSIITSSDGSIYVAGWTESNDGDFEGLSIGEEDIFILKLDLAGNIVYVKTVGGTGSEQAKSIIESSNDLITLTGWTDSGDGDFYLESGSSPYIFLFFLDSEGNFVNR